MNKLLVLTAALLVCGVGASGCHKSDETKSDTATGTDKMSSDKMSGDKMASTDATLDKVKAALADPKFKDVTPKHEDGKVKLTGKVADNDTKKAAEKAVKDSGVTEPVMNMLTVEKH
jgi:osmotically-inducible protein OsmY